MSNFILKFHLLGYGGMTFLVPITLLVKVPSKKEMLYFKWTIYRSAGNLRYHQVMVRHPGARDSGNMLSRSERSRKEIGVTRCL